MTIRPARRVYRVEYETLPDEALPDDGDGEDAPVPAAAAAQSGRHAGGGKQQRVQQQQQQQQQRVKRQGGGGGWLQWAGADSHNGLLHPVLVELERIFSAILVVFAVGVSWKQFGGKPIECTIPEQVPGIGSEEGLLVDFKLRLEKDTSFREYVEMYCFSKDTYFIPWDEDVPVGEVERKTEEISYYQWVPFFLLAQALLFRIPCMVWKLVASHSGIKVHHLVAQASEERNIDVAARKNTIVMLTTHIVNALRYHRRVDRRRLVPHALLRFMNLPYSSAYVTIMYLFCKLLYLFNVMASFVWLNRFMLKTDHYSMYGYEALRDLLNGTNWAHSGLFPRVTLCDFPVRTLGQIQHFTIQCAMVINLMNEKIFIFLWCWYVILTTLTAISTVYWILVALIPWFRKWFIVRHLELADMPFDAKELENEVERFVFNFLHVDGVFILRMVTGHAGVVMGTDLTMALWKNFYGITDQDQTGYGGGSRTAGAESKGGGKDGGGKGGKNDDDDDKKNDRSNNYKTSIEEPDTAELTDKYIPDFSKSPIFKEEQEYDRAVEKLRRRSSVGRQLMGESQNLLTAIVTTPGYAGGAGAGDSQLGDRLMAAMQNRHTPMLPVTPNTAGDKKSAMHKDKATSVSPPRNVHFKDVQEEITV